MKVDLSCPIELSEYSLPTEENPVSSFTFFNLGEKQISSIQITLTFYDEKDEVLSRRVERPMALEAAGKKPFTVEVENTDSNVDSVDLVIDKVWFEDGKEWRRAQEARLVDYEPNELPPNRKLEQLRYVAGPDAVGFPSEQKTVWVCVCGRVNALDEACCRRCAREQDEVFSLYTPQAVQAAIDQRDEELEAKARQAREEASRQEFLRQDKKRRKKRARRIRTAIGCVTLALGATAYLFVVLGLPELRYQTAQTEYHQGNVKAAREAFVELADYRESPEMVQYCDLQIAREHLESGDEERLVQAQDMLKELGAFENAQELLKEADYRQALMILEKGEYEEASRRLLKLSGYKEADEKRKLAEYSIACDLFTGKNYEEAALKFQELKDYQDSVVKAKECVYLPALTLMAEEKYDEAAEAFGSITGYKDANTQRLQCIYQSALKAQLAGDYDYAAERFALLGNFADADDQVKRSIYLAAEESFKQGNYETAKKLYDTVEGYEDAAEKSSECIYTPARALMTDEAYDEAAEMFLQIPGYQDADALLMECRYLPGVKALENGEYDEAIERLSEISDYEDSAELIEKARYLIAEEALENGDYAKAIEDFAAMGEYSDAADRLKEAQYALAQQAFEAGQYALASERFEELGKYSDAQKKVKECAYQLALLLKESGELEAAYEAFAAIENYEAAQQAAKETLYLQAEQLELEENRVQAAELFEKAGKYLDAPERAKACLYAEAKAQMDAGSYQRASELFASLGNYQESKALKKTADDLWLSDIASRIAELYEQEDYAAVVAQFDDNGIDASQVPKTYAQTRDMYYDSNLKVARLLINDDRALDAYHYLVNCDGYKNSKDLLKKTIFMVLGTWETKDGSSSFAFYLDGTCIINGETSRFNILSSNMYGVLIGDTEEEMERVYSYTNGDKDGISLRHDDSGKVYHLVRVKQAEVSPTAADEEPVETVTETITVDEEAGADEAAEETEAETEEEEA